MTCGVPPEKGRLRDECLNVSWFRTRGDVQRTLANWREAYHCERPHSSLGYRAPAEFRQALGYAEVETAARFPLPHSLGSDETISTPNLNQSIAVING